MPLFESMASCLLPPKLLPGDGREQGLERGSSRSRTGTRGSAGQARMWAGDVSSGAGASSSLPLKLNLLINSAEGLSASSTSWSGLFVPEETSSS